MAQPYRDAADPIRHDLLSFAFTPALARAGPFNSGNPSRRPGKQAVRARHNRDEAPQAVMISDLQQA
jgi:hypothetical protein